MQKTLSCFFITGQFQRQKLQSHGTLQFSIFGFVERGFETRVEPTLGMPLSETSCDSCGLCVSTCPTGALTAKAPLPEAEAQEQEDAVV